MDDITRLARPEILAMKPYSSARTESGQEGIAIFLDANENPYPPFPATADHEGLNRYPKPQPEHLLELFAGHYGAASEQLLITRGADEAIDLLMRGFCAAGQDGILITPPTFGMYAIAAEIQNAAVHEVPLRADTGFQLDVEGIRQAASQHPGLKLVFICTPNNPTGNLMRKADVLGLCSSLLGRVLVVADEAYVAFSGRPSLATEVASHPNLVVLRTLSKEHSLAGERCGVTIAHPAVISIMGRMLAPYPLTASSVRAIGDAMSESGRDYAAARVRILLEQRDVVSRALERCPGVTRVHPSDANFLLVEVADPRLFLQTLAGHGVRARDRSALPGIEGCVRLSIGTPEQNSVAVQAAAQYGRAIGARGVAAHRSSAG